MTTTNPNLTVGALVAARPGRARVFERFGIDYCCGGKLPLHEACDKRGLDAAAVLSALDEADASPPLPGERDWARLSATELCDHIEATHHAMLKRELPRLAQMTARVASVHGHNHPAMVEVARIYADFAAELMAHMNKEERVLFPMIRAIERGLRPTVGPGSVASPVSMMIHEHDDAGAALARMRELTGGYAPPEGACGTFRATLEGLEAIERDMHQHVHEENNILFPSAIRLEAALRPADAGCGCTGPSCCSTKPS